MFNPATWFVDFVQGAANGIANAYASLLIEIVKILVNTSLPSVTRLQSSAWFMTGLGGTYGFARIVSGLVAIVVCAYALLTPTRNHGQRLSRVFTSIILVGVFAVAFFPVYGIAVSLSKGLVQAMLNLAQGSPNATPTSIVDTITSAALPMNPFGKLITALLAALFGGGSVVESFGLQVGFLFLIFFYPIVIAARPLGRPANAIFNACNAGIFVVLLSLPAMAIGLLAPVLGRNFVPLGNTGVAAFALTVLGGIFAMFAPAVLLVFFYQKSSEVFGRLDASVGGRIDIASMPTVTTREMDRSVDDSHGGGLKAFVSSVAIGAAGADLAKSDNLFHDMKSLVVEGGSVAAATAGHPEIAAVLQTVNTTLTKETRDNQAQGNETRSLEPRNPEGGEA